MWYQGTNNIGEKTLFIVYRRIEGWPGRGGQCFNKKNKLGKKPAGTDRKLVNK